MSDEHEDAGRTGEPAVPKAAPGISRRGLLFGGGLGLGAVAGAAAAIAVPRVATPADTAAGETTGAVASRGVHQAGIDRPHTPQRNALVVVADLDDEVDAARVRAALAAAGGVIDRCTDRTRADPLLLPDGPGDLAVTVGLGPRLVRAIDPALPGSEGLPTFASDTALPASTTGGDLLVAVYASDAAVLHGVADAVLRAVPDATRRWAQQGVRGAGRGTVARNPLGYHDGIVVPHTAAELTEGVWLADGPAAGGTIAVIRRLRLDIAGFHALPVHAQDAVIGRERTSGAPLSGGARDDEANLTAKTAAGEYLVPLHSHVRAAHPSFTGSPLMLRRGYAYSNATTGEPDDGLLFMSFQNHLDTFIRTQHRLDETDDLSRFITTTASASFLIPPGQDGDAPLGASLGSA